MNIDRLVKTLLAEFYQLVKFQNIGERFVCKLLRQGGPPEFRVKNEQFSQIK